MKNPDRKKALSIVEASEMEMIFTLSLEVSDMSSSTIIRNIYECFRMLGDAILISKGITSKNHIEPIKELMSLDVKTERPLNLIDNLRRLRHNINYYGYKPKKSEAIEVISIAETLFHPILKEVKKII